MPHIANRIVIVIREGNDGTSVPGLCDGQSAEVSMLNGRSSMRALLITHGSRGDVQPFAALAKALSERGHSVTMAAPSESIELARPYCEKLFGLHDGPNVLADDHEVVKGLEAGFRGFHGRRRLITTVPKTRRLMRLVLEDLATMARELVATGAGDFDIAVTHVAGAGHDVAEFLGVQSVLMCPQPYWVPTDAFPDPSFRWRVPERLNRGTYGASRLVWWAFSGSSTSWRKERLGLSRRRGGRFRQVDGARTTVFHPFSPQLLPPSTRYPSYVHTTGFWTLPTAPGWSPPDELSHFLAAGEAPVFLGFASLVTSDPERFAKILREAVRIAEVRAVVVGGWSRMEPEDLGDGVAYTRSAPFDWLFQRVRAVVHHGGLGTTGTALAAGCPQVVCPLLPDQRFSGRRMHALGVAPAPIHQRGLTSEGLAEAIRTAARDQAIAVRAKEIGELIAAEQGTSHAVQVLESLAYRRAKQ